MLKIKIELFTIFYNLFWRITKMSIYLQPLWRGTLAQLVEQRTENPCVPGSIPGGTTLKPYKHIVYRVFLFYVCSFVCK